MIQEYKIKFCCWNTAELKEEEEFDNYAVVNFLSLQVDAIPVLMCHLAFTDGL